MPGGVSDVEAEQFWADWWGSDVLSIVLVVPVILLLGRAAPPRGRLGWEALGWLVVTAVAVGLGFADKLDPVFPAWLWLILGAPLVVLYGVRFGLLAMSLFLFVLDFIAVSLTSMGLGPFQQLAFSVEGTPLRSLQLVLIVLAVTVQSVSLLVYAALRHGRTLAGQQALLDAVIEGSPVATAVLDTHDGHRVLRTNAAFRELLPDASAVADFSTLFPLSERDGLARLLSADSQRASGEFAVTDSHGEPGLVQSRVATVTADAFDKYGTLRPAAVAYRVVQAEDMTDVRRRELRLQHAADTDSLTGLANRRTLLKTLESEIGRAAPGRLLTVAFVDLDGFKEVNHRRGHHAGDQVLCDVARCLSDSVRPEDLVARVGGDEFVVVSSEVPDHATALALAERLLERIVHNPATSGLVAASIGLVVQEDPNVTADALLQRADALMYDAKSRGGGKVVATPE